MYVCIYIYFKPGNPMQTTFRKGLESFNWPPKPTLIPSVLSHSVVTLCDLVNCRSPSSSVMGFSRSEFWPFPSPEDLLDPGIELGSPALQADSSAELPGKPYKLLLSPLLQTQLFAFTRQSPALPTLWPLQLLFFRWNHLDVSMPLLPLCLT